MEVLAAVLRGILEILGKLCEGHELIWKVDESDEVNSCLLIGQLPHSSLSLVQSRGDQTAKPANLL